MSEKQRQVACVIPAFNEERTVASIARLAIENPLIDKVIVVDDGSTDSTNEKAKEVEGVVVVRNEKNQGKGAAMRTGLDSSDEPVVLFLDADLLGLTSDHISDLLSPVLENGIDMTVGLFRGGRLHTDLAHVVAPSLSGQRVVRRSVIENMDMDSVGFGIERALTELWETGKISVKEVILHGVTHRTKEEKRGFFEGVRQRIGMYWDIVKFETGKLKKRINEKNND